MCFYIDRKNNPDLKVAETDIVVYKRMKRVLFFLVSPIQSSIYFPFITRGNVNLQVDFDDFSVEKGYHSFASVKAASESGYWGDTFKFVIPKGANYYFNSDNDEYVSSKIRLVSLLRQ